MEFLPKNPILKYKPNTLQYLRNQYGFDTLKRMNDAIDVLQEWAAKQEHFEKKDFDRSFLERLLINNKGSVEKCKKKIDKLCTLRNLIPEFFATDKIDRNVFSGVFSECLLSELTPDYGRVYMQQYRGDDMKDFDVNTYLRYFALIFQYVQLKDYCNDITILVDWQNGSVLDLIARMNLAELRKTFEINFEGLSMRLRGLHIVNAPKTIEALVNLLRTVLGPKLGKRVLAHNTMDTVYEYVPKEILPQEYGGYDKPLSILKDELYNELYSPEFTEYRKEMNKARTNEALRQRDIFNEEYMGMSGTFRTMTVD